ncbi:MAG: type II toxin-antitoxin system RelE/ParE family toxin [Verrucomicrobiota bacterium]|jgi:plasmid stabilization system protein ParE
MSFRVVIEQEAEREFAEAVEFYDEREPGLGQRFAREVNAFFKIVCENPERFPLASRLTRKARIPSPWPYSAYFAIKRETSQVVISVIWHGARNPAQLRRRLK